MDQPGLSQRSRWLILAGSLGLVVLSLGSQIQRSRASADCVERAKFELISCIAPPEAWQYAVTIGLGVALAVLVVTQFHAVR